MVITVEGYDGKKNKAPFVASSLSGMLSMSFGRKVLAINLIDIDKDTIERIVMGIGQNDYLQDDFEARLSQEGIDQLLIKADVQKLMKADFDRYVTPVLKLENRFDIASITKNDSFTEQLVTKEKALRQLISNAKLVYEDVVLLLPSKNENTAKFVRELEEEVVDKDTGKKRAKKLVDASIYCLHQGFVKKYDAAGDNVIYLVTDFEPTSRFTLQEEQKNYVGTLNNINIASNKRVSCLKLTKTVQGNDAAILGNLARFIKLNREPNKEDINYNWTMDMNTLVNRLISKKYEEYSTDWENAEFFERKETSSFEDETDELELNIPENDMSLSIEDDEVFSISKPLSRKEKRQRDKAMKAFEKQAKIEEKKRLAEEERAKKEFEEAERLRKIEEERKAKEAEEERIRKLEEANRLKENAEKKKRELEELQKSIASLIKESNEADEAAKVAALEVESITPVDDPLNEKLVSGN